MSRNTRALIAQGTVLLSIALLCGCASSPDDIDPTYLSPNLYQSYSCDQLAEEGQRVAAQAAKVSGQQNKKHTGDVLKTTVGIVIFWPVLLTNEGDGQTAAELANLKGQMIAIEQ